MGRFFVFRYRDSDSDPAGRVDALAQILRQLRGRVVLADDFVHGQLISVPITILPHHHANAFRGSNASRTASPMKIRSESMMATVKNPVSPSQGACTLALPCESSSPSEGEPGGSPKPRKSSAVNVITEEERMNGRNVRVATMALGNRCRNMIFGLETPSARAAWTYSKLRPRRNSARTRPTSDTQENSSRIPSSTKKPGTSTEEMISSR